jgi:hypothetical protein
MGHSLTRTSPKGDPFIGTCTKCGMQDIPLGRMHEPCINPANLSDNDALNVALGLHDGETKQ